MEVRQRREESEEHSISVRHQYSYSRGLALRLRGGRGEGVGETTGDRGKLEEASHRIALALDASQLPRRWLEGRVREARAIWPRAWECMGALRDGYERAADAWSCMQDMCGECEQDERGAPDDSMRGAMNVSERGAQIKNERGAQWMNERGAQDVNERGALNGNEHGALMDTGTVISNIKITLQRRMVGLILHRIRKAQAIAKDVIATPTDRLTADQQRLLIRMNHLLWPCVKALCQLSERKELCKISNWWTQQGFPQQVHTNHVVYLRFNTRTEHVYIGETEDYERRMKRHAYETFRHSVSCTNACRGCKEHQKYRHHRVASCAEWITVPITVTQSKAEGKRMELLFRLRWKPQINGEDKAYHLMKNTYARDIKRLKGGSRRDQEQVPWKRPRRQQGGRLMTTYDHHGT